jgi:hypothetical protein
MSSNLQLSWLKANIGTRFARKLLRLTREIGRQINPHTNKDEHQFPILAGSHLTQVG